MRVAQIHNRYRFAGGEDQVVRAEAEVLRSAGHDVLTLEGVNPTTVIASSMTMVVAPWNPVSRYDISRRLHDWRPDVVHIHNTWFALSPSVVSAAHSKAAVVMTLHNYRLGCANGQLIRHGEPCRLCLDGSLWNSVIHNCYHNRVASAIGSLTIAVNRRLTWPSEVDLYLTPTRYVAEQARYFRLPTGKIAVKPHFTPDPGGRSDSPTDSNQILYVGRLSTEKGIHMLLANIELFIERGLELRVVGDGPMRPEVENQLGRGYLGPLENREVLRRMMESRALVVPSLQKETQSLVALEAFSAALPVAGSTEGAIGETVRSQGPGWDFDPRGSWLPIVDRLSNDDAVARGSAAARGAYLERFAWNQGAETLETMYELAIANHADCLS